MYAPDSISPKIPDSKYQVPHYSVSIIYFPLPSPLWFHFTPPHPPPAPPPSHLLLRQNQLRFYKIVWTGATITLEAGHGCDGNVLMMNFWLSVKWPDLVVLFHKLILWLNKEMLLSLVVFLLISFSHFSSQGFLALS